MGIRSHRRPPTQPPVRLALTSLMDVVSVIVVYLLTSYSNDPSPLDKLREQELPRSTIDMPAEGGQTIYVSMRAVYVDDKKVLKLEDGRIPLEEKKKNLVGSVYDVLACECCHSPPCPGPDWHAQVGLVVDPRVEFSTLRDIMYTAGRAEYDEFDLRVLQRS